MWWKEGVRLLFAHGRHNSDVPNVSYNAYRQPIENQAFESCSPLNNKIFDILKNTHGDRQPCINKRKEHSLKGPLSKHYGINHLPTSEEKFKEIWHVEVMGN